MPVPKSKLVKSPSLTVKVEEDYIYIILCCNIHGQQVTIGTEPTLAAAETFRTDWIENHTNRYWCKEGLLPDVYFQRKSVLKGEL